MEITVVWVPRLDTPAREMFIAEAISITRPYLRNTLDPRGHGFFG